MTKSWKNEIRVLLLESEDIYLDVEIFVVGPGLKEI
jgi:hypothetical protein